MDITKAQDTLATNDERIKLARDYSLARKESYMNKYHLDMVLVSKLSEIRAIKANCGIDMAYLMLLEPNFLPEAHRKETQEYYKLWKLNEAKYKGLERLLSAVESKVTFTQSLMRYERDST